MKETSYPEEHLLKKLFCMARKIGVFTAKRYAEKNTLSETQQKELFKETSGIVFVKPVMAEYDSSLVQQKLSKKNRSKVRVNKINNIKDKSNRKTKIRKPRAYARGLFFIRKKFWYTSTNEIRVHFS